MSDDLMQWSSGELEPRREDRKLAKRAKDIYDEVREKDFMARGAFALGADIMDQTVQLDTKRQQLSTGDPFLDRLLAEEELSTVRQAQEIQKSLYKGTGW